MPPSWGRKTKHKRENKSAMRRRFERWKAMYGTRWKQHVVINGARERAVGKARNDLTVDQWAARHKAANGHCMYCGKKKPKLELEHVIPLSLEGDNSYNNIVAACRTCNARKGARSLAQWLRDGGHVVNLAGLRVIGLNEQIFKDIPEELFASEDAPMNPPTASTKESIDE